MFQRIIEIIVYVITELKSNKPINDIDIERLKSLGYTNSEISTAFSWLVDKYQFDEQNIGTLLSKPSKNSFRVLHEAESELFTDSAKNELIHYYLLGLMSNENIEQLIERTVLNGYSKIDSDSLKIFIAGAVFDAFRDNANNSKIMLTGNETIH